MAIDEKKLIEDFEKTCFTDLNMKQRFKDLLKDLIQKQLPEPYKEDKA